MGHKYKSKSLAFQRMTRSGQGKFCGGQMLLGLMCNPFYRGAHVVCKTHQKGIRSNTFNIIPREQREVIFEAWFIFFSIVSLFTEISSIANVKI